MKFLGDLGFKFALGAQFPILVILNNGQPNENFKKSRSIRRFFGEKPKSD